ncbi:MAG: hypothetical protein S4CHLAM102_04790 [Chlamydiia bacterium]|nr:hypothetical protein [Chlamydiia bacterium]
MGGRQAQGAATGPLAEEIGLGEVDEEVFLVCFGIEIANLTLEEEAGGEVVEVDGGDVGKVEGVVILVHFLGGNGVTLSEFFDEIGEHTLFIVDLPNMKQLKKMGGSA